MQGLRRKSVFILDWISAGSYQKIRDETAPSEQRLPQPNEKPPEGGYFLEGRRGAYFKLSTQAASFWASASLTWLFAGMGTGPQTPLPPLTILLANLALASLWLA